MGAKSRKQYTVKQVAELSGVTARTLHHYDEIGLLKPACVGTNGYRYYETEQLDRLREVLRYKDLGLELETISRILAGPQSDRAAELRKHRQRLVLESEKFAERAILGDPARTFDRVGRGAGSNREAPRSGESFLEAGPRKLPGPRPHVL
jgi:DNA-binding transcriptional MerR regulator